MPLRALRERPERAALLTDFDGTLSEIVADPATARPVPGVVEVLGRLTDRLGLVGVVHGVVLLAKRKAKAREPTDA